MKVVMKVCAYFLTKRGMVTKNHFERITPLLIVKTTHTLTHIFIQRKREKRFCTSQEW